MQGSAKNLTMSATETTTDTKGCLKEKSGKVQRKDQGQEIGWQLFPWDIFEYFLNSLLNQKGDD